MIRIRTGSLYFTYTWMTDTPPRLHKSSNFGQLRGNFGTVRHGTKSHIVKMPINMADPSIRHTIRATRKSAASGLQPDLKDNSQSSNQVDPQSSTSDHSGLSLKLEAKVARFPACPLPPSPYPPP